MNISSTNSIDISKNSKIEEILVLWIPFILLYLYCLFFYSYFAIFYFISGVILLNLAVENYYLIK